jgi:nicotinate-nucleotide adenylyltransferase
VEGELGGRSRTYDTMVHLQRTHPELSFSLLIGADILQEQDSWYRFEDLQRLVPVKVLGRSGYPSPAGAPLLPPISSSEIRRRLAAGQEVSAVVPAAVLAYIERHGLYRR